MHEHGTPISSLIESHVARSAIDLQDGDYAEEEKHHPQHFVALEESTQVLCPFFYAHTIEYI
jgi:hypothetical protein